MPRIDTLVADIEGLFGSNKEFQTIDDYAAAHATTIASRVTRSNQPASLRMSNLGTNCDRKLWYSVNHPELAEVLEPNVRMKFLFGDILEGLLIFLAKEAGHTVTHEQLEVEIDGVPGHIDCIIDGHLVDCKSASSFSFQKFRDGSLASSDSFGYLTQLSSYLYACKELPELVDKQTASFLVIDKQLGHLCLDTHHLDTAAVPGLVRRKRELLEQNIPLRTYGPVPDGKSGNQKLGTECSYCSFKDHCWPNLRTFIYSSGPRYLTQVARLPDVPEVR